MLSAGFSIRDCQIVILKAYVILISKGKVYFECNCAFEKIYGAFEGYFAELSRFMQSLKYFKSRHNSWMKNRAAWQCYRRCIQLCVLKFQVVNWWIWLLSSSNIDNIKLLIIVATTGNDTILPLTFAIVANESVKTWTLFVNYLHLHVVKDREGVTLISDTRHGILSFMYNFSNW